MITTTLKIARRGGGGGEIDMSHVEVSAKWAVEYKGTGQYRMLLSLPPPLIYSVALEKAKGFGDP